MNWKSELREAIHNTIREMLITPSESCTVKSVDKEAGTIVATDSDNLDYSDVRLKAVIDENGTGMLICPVVGSKVVVSILDGIDTMMFVSQYSDIESFCLTASGGSLELNKAGELLLNGTNFGGLVQVAEIVKKLNRLEERMQTHQHLVAGKPTVPDPVTNAPLLPTTATELENPKVKHG